MAYHGVQVDQCEQATAQRGVDCCVQSPPGNCNQGGFPEFEKYGFVRPDRTTNTELSWDEVRKQIFCKKLPFLFSWHTGGDSGHMFVGIGYLSDQGTNFVEMHDPIPYREPTGIGDAFAIIPYDVYAQGLPDCSHWDDLYNIRKTP